MDKKIVWSKRANENFLQVLDYLTREWGSNVAFNFIDTVDNTITKLSKQPLMGRKISESHYEFLVTKHNLLIYKVTDTILYIIAFYDTRQNPENPKI